MESVSSSFLLKVNQKRRLKMGWQKCTEFLFLRFFNWSFILAISLIVDLQDTSLLKYQNGIYFKLATSLQGIQKFFHFLIDTITSTSQLCFQKMPVEIHRYPANLSCTLSLMFYNFTQVAKRFIIFRSYFIYGKGKYLNQTVFFTKFAKHQNYIKL